MKIHGLFVVVAIVACNPVQAQGGQGEQSGQANPQCGDISHGIVSPTSIVVAFDDTSDLHELSLNLSYTSPSTLCPPVILYVGDIDLPYDRDLPVDEDVFTACATLPTWKDWRYEEQYVFSCCNYPLECGVTGCSYNCVLPHAPEPDIFDSFGMSNSEQIWVRNPNSSWALLSQHILYEYETSLEGVLKRSFTMISLLLVSSSAVSVFMDTFNKHVFDAPFAFLVLHVALSALMLVWLSISTTDIISVHTNRHTTLRFGILHAQTTISFSILSVYTPPRKHAEGTAVPECRVEVSYGSRFWRCIHSEFSKTTIMLIFLLNAAFQALAAYSIGDIARERLGASWPHIAAFTVCYFIATLIFMLAFLTAIYDISPNIQVLHNKTFRQRSRRFFYGSRKSEHSLKQFEALDGSKLNFTQGQYIAVDIAALKVFPIAQDNLRHPMMACSVFKGQRRVQVSPASPESKVLYLYRVQRVYQMHKVLADLTRVGTMKQIERDDTYTVELLQVPILRLYSKLLRFLPHDSECQSVVESLRNEWWKLLINLGIGNVYAYVHAVISVMVGMYIGVLVCIYLPYSPGLGILMVAFNVCLVVAGLISATTYKSPSAKSALTPPSSSHVKCHNKTKLHHVNEVGPPKMRASVGRQPFLVSTSSPPWARKSPGASEGTAQILNAVISCFSGDSQLNMTGNNDSHISVSKTRYRSPQCARQSSNGPFVVHLISFPASSRHSVLSVRLEGTPDFLSLGFTTNQIDKMYTFPGQCNPPTPIVEGTTCGALVHCSSAKSYVCYHSTNAKLVTQSSCFRRRKLCLDQNKENSRILCTACNFQDQFYFRMQGEDVVYGFPHPDISGAKRICICIGISVWQTTPVTFQARFQQPEQFGSSGELVSLPTPYIQQNISWSSNTCDINLKSPVAEAIDVVQRHGITSLYVSVISRSSPNYAQFDQITPQAQLSKFRSSWPCEVADADLHVLMASKEYGVTYSSAPTHVEFEFDASACVSTMPAYIAVGFMLKSEVESQVALKGKRPRALIPGACGSSVGYHSDDGAVSTCSSEGILIYEECQSLVYYTGTGTVPSVSVGFDGSYFYFQACGCKKIAPTWSQRSLCQFASGEEFLPVLYMDGWTQGLTVRMKAGRAEDVHASVDDSSPVWESHW